MVGQVRLHVRFAVVRVIKVIRVIRVIRVPGKPSLACGGGC